MAQRATTRVCFTLNNYTNENWEALKTWGVDNCKYIVIGKEVGEQGTPHLQGFFIAKKQKRMSTWTNTIKKLTGKQPYTTPANGSNDQAADYCKKDGVYFENGAYPKGKGTRTDIKEFLEAAAKGASDIVLAETFPTEFAKYNKAADKLRTAHERANKFAEVQSKYSEAALRAWQTITIRKLLAQDDRKVTWVYDPVGNIGKSFLANYLVANHKAYLIEGGKRADVAYAYNYEPIVVFDYTRSQEEQVNYSLIESFKNGRMFSPKYQSGMKIFAPCKVLCLSNFDPDRSKLSEDRWQVLSGFKTNNNDNPFRLSRKRSREQLDNDPADDYLFAEDLPPAKKPRLSRHPVRTHMRGCDGIHCNCNV